MKTFVIDSANSVHLYASNKAARGCRDGTMFSTENEFAAALGNWPMPRLLSVWNQLPKAKPARKFANRDAALRRIWATIQGLAPVLRSKADLVIGMINRPSGATLKEIMAATGWQAHSVRGFLSAQPKKLGIQVESFKRERERVYRLR